MTDQRAIEKPTLGSAIRFVLRTRVITLPLLCCLVLVPAFGQPTPAPNPPTQAPSPSVHQHGAMSHATPTEPSPKAGPMGLPVFERKPGTVTLKTRQIPILDLTVLDQDGRSRHFYTDLIKDKVVVLTFFFTSCTNFCPGLALALSKLQANLGDRLGKDVSLVSVSTDPKTDTPQKLRAFGKAHGAKRGWTMVTGDLDTMRLIVYEFVGGPLGQAQHEPFFFVGSDRTGKWTTIPGNASLEDLQRAIDGVMKPGP